MNRILTIVVLFTLLGCGKDVMNGEGPNITETRLPGTFTGIETRGSTNVTVFKGDEMKVMVTGHGNLVPIYETVSKDGRLVLGYDDKYNVKNDNIRVEVYLPTIDYLEINGSGKIVVKGEFIGQSVENRINGSGDISMDQGSFHILQSIINGSGSITTSNINAIDGYAEISGSGDIDIRVSKSLDARINGSGNINYWGNPFGVNTSINGSGKVNKKE